MGLVLEQYEMVIVNLDPTIGSEIKKTRPCVILSPNEMNEYLKTIVIAPLTSKSKDYPTRVKIEVNGKESWIAVDQIRTIDRRRIYKKINRLTDETITAVKKVIKEMLVD